MNDVAGPFANSRNAYVLNLIGPVASDRVLNVGIGNVPEIEMALEPRVRECWTLDADRRKLAFASRFLDKTRLVCADLLQPPLPDGHFTKVVMLEVLEHLKDDAGALARVHDLMCEGGTLVLSVPNRHPLHVLNPIMYLQHERHYSNAGLAALLERSGFAIRHLNVVEDWRLLANLYLHLVRKFVLHRTGPFEVFTRRGNRTYSRLNRRGLDIVVQAVRR